MRGVILVPQSGDPGSSIPEPPDNPSQILKAGVGRSDFQSVIAWESRAHCGEWSMSIQPTGALNRKFVLGHGKTDWALFIKVASAELLQTSVQNSIGPGSFDLRRDFAFPHWLSIGLRQHAIRSKRVAQTTARRDKAQMTDHLKKRLELRTCPSP
jgi:hypothetical protein